jgi:hypothetical protein
MQYAEIIETLGAGIDIAGVVLIIIGLLIATGRYVLLFRSASDGYTRYPARHRTRNPARSGSARCGRHHPHGCRHAYARERGSARRHCCHPHIPELQPRSRIERTLPMAEAQVRTGCRAAAWLTRIMLRSSPPYLRRQVSAFRAGVVVWIRGSFRTGPAPAEWTRSAHPLSGFCRR